MKVNHVSLSVKKHQLDILFGKHGLCEVHLRHQYGQSEQYAFVNYASQEAARTAARELNGTTLSGGRLTVKVQGERSFVGEYTVKVENLSKETTQNLLEDLFGFFGNVEIASIKLNTPANSPFNYAYVNYYNAEDAQKAVGEFNNTKIEGWTVKVKMHRSQSGTQLPFSASPVDHGWHSSLSRQLHPSKNHSSYGHSLSSPTDHRPLTSKFTLPFEQRRLQPSSSSVKVSLQGHLMGEDLEMIFSQFGTITSTPTIIPGNPNFAYVNFSSPDEAKAALCMNWQLIKGVPVGVKLKKDSKRNNHSIVPSTSESHDYLQVHCEQLIIQLITSPNLLQYKLQLQKIENSLSVKVLPMKGGSGFSISGNQKSLEDARLQLKVVISQVKKEFDEESFTLPCHYVPAFGNPEVIKLVTKIEQKHYVEFKVYESSTQQPVDMSIFSQFVSVQLKHTQSPAKITSMSKFLSTSMKSECTSTTEWLYTDDERKLIPYTKQQSSEIEKAWSSGHKTLSMVINHHRYQLDLTQMKQVNITSCKERKIMRKPCSSHHINFQVNR